jgi:hypothetical protein
MDDKDRVRFLREKAAPAPGGPFGAFLEPKYQGFFADEFLGNPLRYLEQHGLVKKPRRSDSKKHERTADAFKVFEFANLRREGQRLSAIVKIVDSAEVVLPDRSGRLAADPLLELHILRWLKELRLPGAEPIGHLTNNACTLILYEKLNGHTTKDPDIQTVYQRFGAEQVRRQVDARLELLRPAYEAVGIQRHAWRARDAVFVLDPQGVVSSVVPIDWEKTTIDWTKLDQTLRGAR